MERSLAAAGRTINESNQAVKILNETIADLRFAQEKSRAELAEKEKEVEKLGRSCLQSAEEILDHKSSMLEIAKILNKHIHDEPVQDDVYGPVLNETDAA